jgi:hypothetical protein
MTMLHGYGMNERAATLAAWRYSCACSLIQITAALVPDDFSCEPPQSTRALNRSVAFDVMKKDRAAIRLYEQMGAIPIGDITHHHSQGLNEPAVVYIAPTLTD